MNKWLPIKLDARNLVGRHLMREKVDMREKIEENPLFSVKKRLK